MKQFSKLILIGGSWGGIQASITILKALPASFPFPIVIVLHRLRNQEEGNLEGVFKNKLALKVVELEEKEELQAGYVYLAPANYHVLIEKDYTFSLDVSDLENYSRPSIDVTFTSAADTFGTKLVGILLSGASKDGSLGLKAIAGAGGVAIVQDPAEAEVETMPLAAIEIIPECKIMGLAQIRDYLLSLT